MPFINQIFIQDKSSIYDFLIDTGADVSCLPKRYAISKKPAKRTLFAANSSSISTYWEQRLNLNLGLRRTFEWTCIVADVKTPIIGNDFLNAFDLIVYVRNAKILDGRTSVKRNLSSYQNSNISNPLSIKSIHVVDQYTELLSRFKSITQMNNGSNSKTDTVHHIETSKGPPGCRKSRISILDEKWYMSTVKITLGITVAHG